MGIIVGDSPDKITFGNETDFAELSISDLITLKYWAFAGTNSSEAVSVPRLSIEVDPNVGSASYATVIYLPDTSVSPSTPDPRLPNTWQQYDAAAAQPVVCHWGDGHLDQLHFGFSVFVRRTQGRDAGCGDHTESWFQHGHRLHRRDRRTAGEQHDL
ncbi:hypothetical protein ACFQX6_19840 [Streptosporangium lutulentum]